LRSRQKETPAPESRRRAVAGAIMYGGHYVYEA
jgi:hypothetical protein